MSTNEGEGGEAKVTAGAVTTEAGTEEVGVGGGVGVVEEEEKEIEQDIDLIISRLIRPIVHRTVERITSEKLGFMVESLSFFGINTHALIEQYVEDGLAYARQLLAREYSREMKELIDYLIRKYTMIQIRQYHRYHYYYSNSSNNNSSNNSSNNSNNNSSNNKKEKGRR